MLETVQNFINEYETYFNIGLGLVIFFALLALRNKLADGILRLIAKVVFVKRRSGAPGL